MATCSFSDPLLNAAIFNQHSGRTSASMCVKAVSSWLSRTVDDDAVVTDKVLVQDIVLGMSISLDVDTRPRLFWQLR